MGTDRPAGLLSGGPRSAARATGCLLLLLATTLFACVTPHVKVKETMIPLPVDQDAVVSASDLASLVSPKRAVGLQGFTDKRLFQNGSYELIGTVRRAQGGLVAYSRAVVAKSDNASNSYFLGYIIGSEIRFWIDKENAQGYTVRKLRRSTDGTHFSLLEEVDCKGQSTGYLFFGKEGNRILVIVLGGVSQVSPAAFEEFSHRKMEQLERYQPRPS